MSRIKVPRISKRCANCGKEFGSKLIPAEAKKRKYCSGKCSSLAQSAQLSDPGRIARMRAMRDQDPPVSISEIGRREGGISRQRVQQLLGKTGHLASSGHANLERIRLIREAFEKDPNTSSVGQKLGLSTRTIYNAAKRHGFYPKSAMQLNRELLKKGKRRCSGPCKKIKHLKEFVRDRGRSGGRGIICLECDRKASKRRYWEKKERANV